MNSVTITPAYGRVIKTRADAIAQLRAGQDFEVHHPVGQGYATMAELKGFGVTHVEVRSGPRLVAVVDITNMEQAA